MGKRDESYVSGERLCVKDFSGLRIAGQQCRVYRIPHSGFQRKGGGGTSARVLQPDRRSLPKNFVENLMMVRGRPVTLKVRLDPEGSILEFAENELAAAIMMYCIKRGIPMARHALKSLGVAHDALFLHQRMGP